MPDKVTWPMRWMTRGGIIANADMDKLTKAFSIVAEMAERHDIDVAVSMMPWSECVSTRQRWFKAGVRLLSDPGRATYYLTVLRNRGTTISMSTYQSPLISPLPAAPRRCGRVWPTSKISCAKWSPKCRIEDAPFCPIVRAYTCLPSSRATAPLTKTTPKTVSSLVSAWLSRKAETCRRRGLCLRFHP